MKLKDYLKGRNRKEFAKKVGTTENVINNLCSDSKYRAGRVLGFKIIKESNDEITPQDLWPELLNKNKGRL